jgi:hypothetical protein
MGGYHRPHHNQPNGMFDLNHCTTQDLQTPHSTIMIMITTFTRLLALVFGLVSHAAASIDNATIKEPKPKLRQTTPSVPRNHTTFSFVLCKDLDTRPTRSVSLAYSYLVESFADDIDLEAIDMAMLDSVGESILDQCMKPSDGHLHSRVVALESRLYTELSDDYCKSGLNCVIVRRKMTLVIEEGNPDLDDSDFLAIVYNAIEASIGSLAFENQTVTFISDKPSLVTRAQSLAVVASYKEGVKVDIGVFVLAFIFVLVFWFIVAIILIAIRRKKARNDACDNELGDLDSAVPASISVPESLSNNNPSERCREIIPVNLDHEHFIFLEELELNWKRNDFPAGRSGFSVELDTITEDEGSV